jgi:hypothetical protein
MTRLISAQTWRNIGTTLPRIRQTFHIAPQSPLSATPWDTRPYVPYKGRTQPAVFGSALFSFCPHVPDLVAFPRHCLHISDFLLCTVWWRSNRLLLSRIPDILNVPSRHKMRLGSEGAWKIDKDLTGGAYRGMLQWVLCMKRAV